MDTLNELLTKLLEAHRSSLPATPLPLAPPPNDVSSEEVKEDSRENSSKTDVPPTKPLNGSGEYARVPFPNSPDLPIAHPPIHLRGAPPSLNASSFTNWQTSMRSHINSASIALWKIIETGYKAVDPTNLTRREEVECQLNATALDLIRVAVGEKDLHNIQHCTTAKDAWNCLADVFIGNESMRRNRYEAMSNQIEGFFMKDGETHMEMYQRLKALSTSFRELGATDRKSVV